MEFKLESASAATKPALTEDHQAKQLKWCLEHKDWTYSKWTEVQFSDESNYTIMNRKTTPYIRQYSLEKFHERFLVPKEQHGGDSVGIWGCMGFKGVGRCQINIGRMNATKYLEVLNDNVLP